ncbi:MAG: hypothetical protein WCP03_02490 [Candidatus Saccharibacteria bacterium]
MEKRITPVDNLTGMPLPIYPFSNEHDLGVELYDGPKTSEDLGGLTENINNWHHAFHPEYEMKSNKAGALFLRHSRVQRVPVWLHDDYHYIYQGPEISDDIEKRFLMGVFAVAGYMPKVAIDVPNSLEEDKIVPLTFSEYKEMIQPDMLKGQFAEKKVRLRQASKFMMKIILKQDVKAVKVSDCKEFLITSDREKRLKMAHLIIEQLADQSTEPINDKYEKARKKKRVKYRGLVTPRDVVLTVTDPFILENLKKLEDKVLEEMAA